MGVQGLSQPIWVWLSTCACCFNYIQVRNKGHNHIGLPSGIHTQSHRHTHTKNKDVRMSRHSRANKQTVLYKHTNMQANKHTHTSVCLLIYSYIDSCHNGTLNTQSFPIYIQPVTSVKHGNQPCNVTLQIRTSLEIMLFKRLVSFNT